MLPDDQLDALLRAAKPRAPAGFEDRVMSRVRRPQVVMLAAAAVLLLAIAGVGSLFLLHRKPTIASSGWFLNAQPIAEGTQVTGPAELTSDDRRASISVAVRVARSALDLDAGAATLRGEAVVVETTPARVTTITPDAEVEVEMNGKKTGVAIGAAGAAVLTVYVVHGAVRVDAHQPPSSKVLVAGDYALVPPNRTPFVARAKSDNTNKAVAVAAAQKPAPAVGKLGSPQPQSPAIQPPPAIQEPEGHLDKEVIRDTIRNHINELKFCYEQEAAKNPNLSGRIVMNFLIREKDGAGRVDEAEIIPGDVDGRGEQDLNSPQVEHCVLTALARWHFPVPEGGGVVRVHYPIIFDQPRE